jgi:prepilin-type N-terminal cleavage/methylation domain-containing protein
MKDSGVASNCPTSRPFYENGFTLLELLVVITLLSVLAGASILAYDGVQEEGRNDATVYDLSRLRVALLQFRRHTGEFPCRVYREGDYVPNEVIMDLDFTALPGPPTLANYFDWCSDNINDQVDWGLVMLTNFPYDETDTTYTPLLWNPDTKRGWYGPYTNTQGIIDAWGNPYVLLDPELDYSPEFRCENDGSGDYQITGGLYSCLTADDAGWVAADYTLAADIARVVSYGENEIYDSAAAADPCVAEGDDFVLCLLK